MVDAAGILPSATEQRLDAKSAKLERTYGHQLVVVTVKTLNRHRIEDYGVTLSRYWQIGRKRYDDGVVLLVAPKEHRVRIEVGYGLEDILRDREAGEIIDKQILPAFSKGDLPGGTEAGVDGIIDQISVRTDT